MENLIYDASEERLGNMLASRLALKSCFADAEDSDVVADETVDAGIVFQRIMVEDSQENLQAR